MPDMYACGSYKFKSQKMSQANITDFMGENLQINVMQCNAMRCGAMKYAFNEHTLLHHAFEDYKI